MLLLSIVFIILLSASLLRRDFSILLSRVTLSNLLLIFSINYTSMYFLPLERGLSLYNGLYKCNNNSHVFNLFLVILCFLILALTSYYPRKAVLSTHNNTFSVSESYYNTDTPKQNTEYVIDKTSAQFKIIEYSLLILFILSGAIFLISTNDIISIFISIELQSYGLYLLSSVYRNSESSTRAGLTYFLLGGLSSCIILLSQGLLYVNSGSTNLENIYILSNLSILNIDNTLLENGAVQSVSILNTDSINNTGLSLYLNISLIILSVGFLFKVSAAPFHFWSPDVYDGVPTLVTTFIAIVAKISIFVFLLELVHFTNNSLTELLSYNWNKNLLLSSLLSLIIGTVLGLTQSRIKRLFAYSTISHVGFILLALSVNSTESIQAFIFYLIQYSISNLNAFIILMSIGYFLINYYNNNKDYTELKEKENSPVQLISQVKGLYKLNTVLALSFGITLFSFLGVPPLIGFFGKQMVLSASLDSGYIFMSLIAILTSVISAVYYLVIIKQVFFDKSEYKNINLISEKISSKGPVLDINREDENKSDHSLSSQPINNLITEQNDKTKTDMNNSTHTLSKKEDVYFIRLSGNLTSTISILTLLTLVFMFIPNESLNLIKILSLFINNI